MKKELVATAFSVLLACGLGASPPTASAEPAQPGNEDEVFFDTLTQDGLRPQYDQQVCGSIKCAPLRELLVEEGHAVCSALGSSPWLVPASVIAHLRVPPDQAHAIIDASRQGYCPQAPDPYTRDTRAR